MASIFRRSSSSIWYIKYSVNGKRVQRSLGTTDRKLAESKRKEIEYLRATQRLHLPSRTPLKPLLESFFDHLRATRKKKSADTDIGRLGIFFAACPVADLEDLTAGAVQDYLDERVLEGELAHKTANEYRVILQGLAGATWSSRSSPAVSEKPSRFPGKREMLPVEQGCHNAPSLSV